MAGLSPPDFVSKWQRSTLSERSAAQQHFIDLYELLGQPRPADVDLEGNTYTFEKGLTKTSGEHGFADVWMRGFFAWEYKGKHRAEKTDANQPLQSESDVQEAHRALDEAVFAAYGWPRDISDEEILNRLLQLNAQRFAAQSQAGGDESVSLAAG